MRKNQKNTTGFSSASSRAFIWFLIVSHLVFAVGCKTTQTASVSGDQIPAGGNIKILRVILKSGETIVFNKDGGKYFEKPMTDKPYRAIIGVTGDGKAVEINPEKILDIFFETESTNVTVSIFLGIISGAAVAGIIFLLILATGKW